MRRAREKKMIQEVKTDVRALEGKTIAEIRDISRQMGIDPDRASDNILRKFKNRRF